MQIPFFKPYISGKEVKYIQDLIHKGIDIGGDGEYTKKVTEFLEKRYNVKKVLLTTSGTTALEMAVQLLDLNPDDEIIVPSFTFTSTANAVLLRRGVKIVFAEIDKATLNIAPDDIEKKITSKTKAIIVVHYAGVACDMDRILSIANKHNLKIIEDAAQGIDAKWKDKYLGTIGDFGCISFHETKNITSGEGGALFINHDGADQLRAEIIREKGTNRTQFFRGEVNKYEWIDVGSSYLPSDILAAFLLAQLEEVENITNIRLGIYNIYREKLESVLNRYLITIPHIPDYATPNAHIFYIIMPNKDIRDEILKELKHNGVQASFHYVPLHSSPQGMKLGYKQGDFPLTENLSERLIRLPLFAGMEKHEVEYVIVTLTKIIQKNTKLQKFKID